MNVSNVEKPSLVTLTFKNMCEHTVWRNPMNVRIVGKLLGSFNIFKVT